MKEDMKIMRIGVIDSDAMFQHPFFNDKKIEIKRMNPGYSIKNNNFPFSHAEYVCACILLENPTAEILLYNIIGGCAENEGELLYRSLEALIRKNVDVINISLGVEIPFSKELYDLCRKSPVPIVAAHANNNQTAYPASYDNVIGIRREFDGDVIIKRSGNQNLLLNNKTYVSFKQLDQEHLMQGNSWYTAKLTGIISCFKENRNLKNEDIFDLIMCSGLNRISSTKQNNSENAILVTNRSDNQRQKEFIRQCFSQAHIVDIKHLEAQEIVGYYDKLFIDIDKYSDFISAKEDLLNFVYDTREAYKHCYIRYPFFSYYERYRFLIEKEILIEQLYF